MSEKVFSGGEVSLEEMLNAREKRVLHQKNLLNEYRDSTVLLASMNIPGPVKNSAVLSRVFSQVLDTIKQEIDNGYILKTLEFNIKTGPEFYAVVACSPKTLKKKMVEIEETHSYGRLLDLDIHYLEEGPQSVSRQDLNLPPRKCLICRKNAKECGRQRRHSIKEMQAKIIEIINKE